MSIEIPESLLRAEKGSRIPWDPVIRSIVDGPKQDGTRATDHAIRRLLVGFKDEYERQRAALGDVVTTTTRGDDLLVHTDESALAENTREELRALRRFRKQARKTRAIDRENLGPDQCRSLDRKLDRDDRTEAAIRLARRPTPELRPHTRTTPSVHEN